MNHFDYYSVLTDRHHGFRSKHSTESQLIITTKDLVKSLNNKLQIDMIILDFSKAFDTVPHNRLLNKLDRYGIRNKTHTWISNFLKYRKQRVVIGGEHTTWTEVMCTSTHSRPYSARYSFSLILMICQIIYIRQSACLQMTAYYTEK